MSENKYLETDKNLKYLVNCNINCETDVPIPTDDAKTKDQYVEMISKNTGQSVESISTFKKYLISKSSKENSIEKSDSIGIKKSSSMSPSAVMYIQTTDDVSTDHTKVDTDNSSTRSKNIQQKTPDKCRFEEVEIKLEEMFAGIEDEQPTRMNNGSETFLNAVTHTAGNEALFEKSTNGLSTTLPEKTFQTKAAVKSTNCILSTQNYKCSDSVDSKSPLTIDYNYKFMKNIQSSRLDYSSRFIAGMHTELYTEKKESPLPKYNSLESNAKDMVQNSKTISKKNKAGAYCRKLLNETKSEHNSKSKIKSMKFNKAEEQGPTKLRQKFKNRRLNNSSSSDNENENDEKTQQTRDMETKYRSPFVFTKSDGTINIVNTATADDCSEKNHKAKKSSSYGHERKNVKGIYSSTLSNKYDADTADSTWICVFCKRGPHKRGLGDLFGPYSISLDFDEFKVEANVNLHNSISDIKKRRKVNVHKDSPNTSDIISSPFRTVDNRLTKWETIMLQLNHEQDTLIGNVRSSYKNVVPSITANNFEVWLHEDCAVWAPNLFLVGSRLVGLDSAIWNSTHHKCVFCGRSGAIVCCLQRDCKETAHLICARENAWLLDESKLWSYCAKHISK